MSPSMYEVPRRHALDQLIGHHDGGSNALFAVVSTNDLGEAAREAISKSAQVLGYRTTGVMSDLLFVKTHGEEGSLSPTTLLQALETLDPLCVVITDREATQFVAQGYHAKLGLETETKLLGRPTRCFEDLQRSLETPSGKQLAWRLLKTLPSRR